jgi:hypothetical protein
VREFTFDQAEATPIVSAILSGPQGSRRIALVFDTGAVLTQIHVVTLAMVGYTPSHVVKKAVMVGAGGERHEGTILKAGKIVTLGKKIENFILGSFDFSELAESGIDGLLGWDVIKQLHLDMNGPAGILKVF